MVHYRLDAWEELKWYRSRVKNPSFCGSHGRRRIKKMRNHRSKNQSGETLDTSTSTHGHMEEHTQKLFPNTHDTAYDEHRPTRTSIHPTPQHTQSMDDEYTQTDTNTGTNRHKERLR
ncbi:hypothetical protein E2C01_040255 [Portunus trituberculatus]|uniref:Uncharacterized protein n=1 Tax=Portunus trituberculatus TaxID=210409 RepID=A0A5B7FM58_PORTR|nr:hypothetical protein [Portunus trituberculatus]